jgi:hypothetical protein
MACMKLSVIRAFYIHSLRPATLVAGHLWADMSPLVNLVNVIGQVQVMPVWVYHRAENAFALRQHMPADGHASKHGPRLAAS